MASWHTIVVPDAPPKIAANLAGLGSGSYDGQVGIIRIGAYPDITSEEFIWSATASRWIGTTEHVVMVSDDAWAIDMARQPRAALTGWTRFNGGVGWELSGPHAQVRTDVTLPAPGGIINTESPLGATIADLQPAGQVLIREVLVTYTGRVVDAAQNGHLTGCTNAAGDDGKTFKAGMDAVIPYAAGIFGGGDPGGWGVSVFPMDRVGEMWAAGFRLQERMNAWMNGSVDLKYMDIAPWYINRDLADDYDAPSLFVPPPAGMLGPGIALRGPAYDIGAYTVPGSHKVYDERGFEMRRGGWSDWVAAAPVKRVLIPVLYGKMQAGALSHGETYAVTLALRWVSP